MLSTTLAVPVNPCCVSGAIHEGTAQGTVQQINGLDVYVTGDVANKVSNSQLFVCRFERKSTISRSDVDPTFSRQNRTIVYLTDIFGWSLINSRLLADELASHGFYVLIPDIFQGDSLDHSILFQLAPRDSAPLRSAEQIASETEIALGQVGPWLIRKRPEVTQPLIESFVKALREDSSIGKIGAAGYCWGGRYSILLADGQVE